MRTQYSSSVLSQFISRLRPQLPPQLDGSTDRATSWGFAPVADYDATGISFDAGDVMNEA